MLHSISIDMFHSISMRSFHFNALIPVQCANELWSGLGQTEEQLQEGSAKKIQDDGSYANVTSSPALTRVLVHALPDEIKWVVVKIMVPLWIPIIIRHRIFRVLKILTTTQMHE